jgi:hypothetical protein
MSAEDALSVLHLCDALLSPVASQFQPVAISGIHGIQPGLKDE